MTGPRPIADEKDERIRLLEYQVEFLRRELTFVRKRHHDNIYSAAYTVSLPLRLLEQLGQTTMRTAASLRATAFPRAPTETRVLRREAVGSGRADLERAIARRIAGKMGRHFAGR